MTASQSAVDGLATAMAALVADRDLDVADALAQLLAACAVATGSAAVAVLTHDRDGGLALLGATSHRASQLEMLQVQASSGPCVDTIALGVSVAESGAEALVGRWGPVGQAIVDAGFTAVETHPMRWRGEAFGGLNLFRTGEEGAPGPGVGQAYADVATLVVVHSVRPPVEQVRVGLVEALEARDVVEQAKGVVAHVTGLDMEGAYDELLRRAARSADTLTVVAERLVRTRGLEPPAMDDAESD